MGKTDKVMLCAELSELVYKDQAEIEQLTKIPLLDFIDAKTGNVDTQVGVFREIDDEGKKQALIFVFRGTQESLDIITDLKAGKTPFKVGKDTESSLQVHKGFYEAYEAVRPEIHAWLKRKKPSKVIFTGHSLGAALATLAALDTSLGFPVGSVSCFTFGSPRVGTKKFVDSFNKGIQQSVRTVNAVDPVTMIPTLFMGYRHVRGAYLINIPTFWWRVYRVFRAMTRVSLARTIVSYHYVHNYVKSLKNGDK